MVLKTVKTMGYLIFTISTSAGERRIFLSTVLGETEPTNFATQVEMLHFERATKQTKTVSLCKENTVAH